MPTSPPYGPVLVGIDGTASGLDALTLGRSLAALTGAPLVLGAVHGYEPLASLFGGPGWPTYADASEWLREASSVVRTDEAFRSVTIGADSVAHGLTVLARREGANLIVLGPSRRGAAGRLRTGSGARRVIHDAPCAVALAPEGWRGWTLGGRPIFGVGIDPTGERSDALAVAARLAAAADAALQVLVAAGPEHEAGAERAARRSAAEAARGLVTTTSRLLDGDPAERLAAAAADLDLLVVGSSRSGPGRAALGRSVSAALAGRTECPLVIVPPGSRQPTTVQRAGVADIARG